MQDAIASRRKAAELRHAARAVSDNEESQVLFTLAEDCEEIASEIEASQHKEVPSKAARTRL